MTLSIIIPSHKRAEPAVRLLQSIADQDFPHKKLQVLLISNLRNKKLRNQVSHWESVFVDFKYKEVGSVGVNKARNMGIRFSGGDILYFLDDDCLLSNKNHLKNLISEHEKHPQVMGIGGPYRALKDIYGLEKFYHEHSQKWIDSVSDSKIEVSQLVGGNASYKREVFDKGFYFDPLIAFGGSEESFNQSLREQGWTLLYNEKLWVFHDVRLSGLAFIKKSFGQGLGSFKNLSRTESLKDMKRNWAFSSGEFSFYAFIYGLFFKLGYFWGTSFGRERNFILRIVHFIFLILKSRWYFLKDYILTRFYGSVVLRLFGWLWYILGRLWYGLGWFYGHVFLRLFGWLWYILGRLWYGLGWFYGHVLLFLFHHFPPMKIYYFSKYQYDKRIKSFLDKRKRMKKRESRKPD